MRWLVRENSDGSEDSTREDVMAATDCDTGGSGVGRVAKSLVVLRVIPLVAGGFIVVWRYSDESLRHNTFTRDTDKWIEGFKSGHTLEALQCSVRSPS